MLQTRINKQEMEQLEDTIELLQTAKSIGHAVWPEHLKSLKEAYEAHDSNDWNKCRSALEEFLEYAYKDIFFFDLSNWSLRHIFRWQKMLAKIELENESDGKLYSEFARIIRKQLLDRIPSRLRLAYKDNLHNLTPGFIEMLRNFDNDFEDSERWDEIIEFMEKEIEPENEI